MALASRASSPALVGEPGNTFRATSVATVPASRLDPESCYRAVLARDSRFDGRFYTGVLTTGIYCRPSCPARPPLRRNVRFFEQPAAAEAAGLRACRRCRPDLAPDAPDVDVRGDLVGRALRLIADGAVDQCGVTGLARRLHVSERHLLRAFTAEVGAGPLAVARSRRVRLARALLDASDLPAADIAFAAGFGSVRQFNDAVRAATGATPTELRAPRRYRAIREQGLVLELGVRQPFDPEAALRWLGAHAVPGLETVSGGVYRRWVPGGEISLEPRSRDVVLRADVEDPRVLGALARRSRRLLDLDADPTAVLEALGALAAEHPGLRVMGAWDPWEGLARTVIGQQVSLKGAATLTGRLVALVGGGLFPDAATVATADLAGVGLTRARTATLQAVASGVARGEIRLDGSVGMSDALAPLRAVPGIGPWTVAMVAMRVLRDPDAWPASDLVLKKACAAAGLNLPATERWRPWRADAPTQRRERVIR
jgi:AraC family transcriptional regulator of adaptative response / DNA-3-methyladenine glycosylase II